MEGIVIVKELELLETADDIRDRRDQVLSKYAQFRSDAQVRRQRLEEAKQFQYFKRDANELESWINEKLQVASDESYKDPTNLQAKIQKHQAFEAEVSAHFNTLEVLDKTGSEMITKQHFNSDLIKQTLDELHRLWKLLLSRSADKGVCLQHALVLVQFQRQCNEVMYWINDKESFITSQEFGTDLEHVKVLQRKYDEFHKDMTLQEYKLNEVNTLGEKLVTEGHPETEVINKFRQDLIEAWQRLRQLALVRQEKLFGAHEIQRFNRDADETMAWIAEKNVALSSDDFGRDLASVQILQRKHEGLERDLAALENKVSALGEEANRLCGIHSDYAEQIKIKLAEIEQSWLALTAQAQDRRRQLDDSYDLHRFLSDYRDLISWINDTCAIINADEVAKDVAGAEALIERHQELKAEIDAREDNFKNTHDAGEKIVEKNYNAQADVLQKMNTLIQEKASLLALWEDRHIQNEQCLDLQLFYRDTEQAETWMEKQEAFLENKDLGDSIDTVEELIKKHDDFEKSLSAQEEKIKALDEFAIKLIEGQHYAADDVFQRRESLLERRAALLDMSAQRHKMLVDSLHLQQFERDCDETKGWINEKLKFATDDSHLDPTNLNAKIQKYHNFEQELIANKSRVEDITSTGKVLVDSSHYATEHISKKMEDIIQLWTSLEEATLSKGSKLDEASQGQLFNRGTEDLEIWLSEIEGQIISEDYGKDLTGVQNLLKKHALLEADFTSHQERIDGISMAADNFVDRGHFDAATIKEKQLALQERYNALQKPMALRKERLKESLLCQQLVYDIDDEEVWIREKHPVVASTNCGQDLIGVQNLIKKHQVILAEIDNHDHQINNVTATGEKMVSDGHFAEEDIKQHVHTLSEHWAELKELAKKRKKNLDDSLQAHQYFADAKEAELWMREKEPLAAGGDFGKDEDSAEALLKKHEALMVDLEAFSSTITNLEEQAAACPKQMVPITDSTKKELVVALFDFTKSRPREVSIQKNEVATLLNATNPEWWKIEINDQQGYVPARYIKKIDPDLPESQENLADANSIATCQNQIRGQFENLMALARERQKKLKETVQAYVLVREAAELSQWIKDKEQHAQDEDVGKGLDQVEVLQKKFDDFTSEMQANEDRLAEMNEIAQQLMSLGQTEAADKIQKQIEELNNKWNALQQMAQERQYQLGSAHEVQRLNRDFDETKEWIQEKDNALNNHDYGKDLRSVQALQRKHEGLERDLAALGDKIRQLDETANQLMKTHPDMADNIYSKQQEISEMWMQLTAKANTRKEKLLDSHDLQRFLSEYRDLSSWIASMMGLVSSEELATDVTGAEALLERHQEHRTEIDARAGMFQNFELFGHQLIQSSHFASPEIQEKLDAMNEARQDLERAWIGRRKKLEESLQLQLFYRDCDQADNWMSSRETFFSSDETDAQEGENVEVLIKKHEDFDKAVNTQEEKIAAITMFADQLLDAKHYASEDIDEKKGRVLDHWQNLKEMLIEKRSMLGESQTFQQFCREADEIENWMAEKLQVATEESFKDPANIQSKHQKHQAFEAELAANADRVQVVLAMGQNLIDKHQCAGSEDAVQQRIDSISEQWDNLTKKTAEKSLKLKEANKQRTFIAAVKDLEFWLSEIESLLGNDDVGKDLVSVQNLLKNHRLVEADIQAHEGRINDMNELADSMVESGKLDTTDIQEKNQSINERYERIKNMAVHRQSRLNESLALHKFFRDIADEESWIKEKKMLLASDDYGRDLTGVQNLQKKHKRLEAEIASHEPAIQAVQEASKKLVGISRDGTAETESRLKKLSEDWSQLRLLADQRGQRLDQSLLYQQFIAKIEEEEAWINEKTQLLSVSDYGDNMAAAQGLLKKHDAFETDYAVHRDRCGDVNKAGDKLIGEGNHHGESIRKRCQQLKDKLETLNHFAASRKRKLEDNLAYLQFIWKTDVVASWIADKEPIVRSEDFGQDPSTVLTLLTKQGTLDAGLAAFENEGIQNITNLKDQLVSGNHEQSTSIIGRHEDLIARWKKLLKDSQNRKKKLLEVQERYRDIEDLYLSFAKKASAFNSWFENAEEDLTDPVRCNSSEEVQALCKAHAAFKVSLSAAREDFVVLEKLDERIKTYNVGPNPYTWFTVEALTETWTSLQTIIKDRDQELANETKRQEQNDDLRKEFAKYAKQFYQLLVDARTSMMEASGSLEQQLEAVKKKAAEVKKRRTDLKKLEELWQLLEDKLILDNKYTEHSTVSLGQQWDQLDQLGMRMQHNLEQQIQARNQSGVSEDALKEFQMMFRHFDKERSGRLSHADFKSCLRALGTDLPVAEEGGRDSTFETVLDIVDPNRDGTVTLQDYMSYMLSRETENVHSSADIENAFRAITTGDRPYVLKDEIYQNLTKDMADYCITRMKPYVDPSTGKEVPGALDYLAFTRNLFSK